MSSVRFPIQFTPEERDRYRALARYHGLELSQFIRSFLTREYRKLEALGITLNQPAKKRARK